MIYPINFSQFRTSSNEAISNYVRHVFAMAPAIITLVALVLVLFFQPSKFSSKTKGNNINLLNSCEEGDDI